MIERPKRNVPIAALIYLQFRNQRKTRTAASINVLPSHGINRLDPNDQGSVKTGTSKETMKRSMEDS